MTITLTLPNHWPEFVSCQVEDGHADFYDIQDMFLKHSKYLRDYWEWLDRVGEADYDRRHSG
jgi:hypothetical protein